MEATAFYDEMVGRNIGVLTAEEQERLKNTCIAVAGCGGMGGLSAEQLVRLGVGHVKIADFDDFCVHNLSRQCGSTTSNVGKNKAEVLGRHFKDINPHLKLDIFKDGVTPENVNKFIKNAKAVIDGTDLSRLDSTIAMYDTARKNDICVVNPNAIGFGVNVFVFGPKTVSLGEFLELSSGIDPLMALTKLVPYIPSYVDPDEIRRIALGETFLPNIAMPQYFGTAIAVSEAVMMVLGKIPEPTGPQPRIFIMDLLDRKFQVTG
ncbi:MAG: ThiF family adenylyltransferase [Candidatus Omnitrophica bacterium]|nr:ThiF family adenylyltransferase [Candidatus Omnitrophota bacterium]